MMPPDFFHRHWTAIEPAVFGATALIGGSVSLVLADVASTPSELGGAFVAFLVFLGTGVLSIVGFTASHITKAVISTLASHAGDQAQKLAGLPVASVLNAQLERIAEASSERDAEIVKAIDALKDSVAHLNSTSSLLNQEVQQQVKRTDRLEDHLFNRRNTS